MKEVVIQISDELYSHIQECTNDIVNQDHRAALIEAVNNGVILPEGHGRIGDLDQILIWMIYRKGIIDKLKCGEVAPVFRDATIIGADKAESEVSNADSD